MAFEFIYSARGNAVGYRYGGYIHDMTGRAVGPPLG